MQRKKQRRVDKWDPATWKKRPLTSVEQDEFVSRMQTLHSHLRRGRNLIRGRVPSRILDVDVVDHVLNVAVVACWEYDPSMLGKGGKPASLTSWFFRNIRWSVPFLMEMHGFQRCFKCKGKKTSEAVCYLCGGNRWLDEGAHCIESLDNFGTQPKVVAEFLDGTVERDCIEVGIIDPQGMCKVDQQWLMRQPSRVQVILQWFTELPIPRRRALLSRLIGQVVPMDVIERELSPDEKLARQRTLSRNRQNLKRDLKRIEDSRRKYALTDSLPNASANSTSDLSVGT